MDYQLSIVNLASALFFIFLIGSGILCHKDLTDGEGWGMVALIGLSVFPALGLSFDFLIQLSTMSLEGTNQIITRNGLGLLFAVVLYYYNQYHSAHIIITAPDDFTGAIALVYQVPHAPKLSRNLFTLDVKLQLPKSGMIFTRSKAWKQDISKLRFIRKDGSSIISLGKDKNGYYQFLPNEISDMQTFQHRGQEIIVRIKNIGSDNHLEAFEKKLEEVKQRLKDVAFY